MNPSTNGATLQDPSRVRALTKEPGDEVYYSTVANALSADLIVTSCDYYRRFLSYLTHAESGILMVQSIPCPVVLVTQNYSAVAGCRGSSATRALAGPAAPVT